MAKASTNEIAKILNRIQGHDNYTVIRDFFEISAIAVRNNVDYGKKRDSYEQRYLSIVKKYRKEDLEVFVEALAVFQGWINRSMNGDIPFRDFAGEIYMDSGTSSDKAGQFFTPYHVSRLMAECNFNKDKLKAEIAADPDHVITIAEPTCGAGGLIVAAIDVLKDAGINYAWNAFVDCGDIDSRCVHMTYLTLSLLGVPAVVRRCDALALDYSETWYTPAYIFAWPHFKSRLRGGKYPATPTVQEVQEAPQEPQTAPVVEVPQVVPAPIPLMDENGQLSLFSEVTLQNWEQLIADKVAMHGVVVTCRTDDARKRNRQNYDRRYDATPKRKAQHKAFAQSPAGKKSQAERGKRYRATEKGKESCRRKSRNYFLRHKDDPEWRRHRLEVQKVWKAKKRQKKGA